MAVFRCSNKKSPLVLLLPIQLIFGLTAFSSFKSCTICWIFISCTTKLCPILKRDKGRKLSALDLPYKSSKWYILFTLLKLELKINFKILSSYSISFELILSCVLASNNCSSGLSSIIEKYLDCLSST